MSNTKYILEKIKIEGELEDIIAKSDGKNVTVEYNNQSMSLTEALAKIFASTSAAQTEQQVKNAIKAAIDDLIDGAPDTYDTLKEIADYIDQDKSGAAAMTEAIAGKVAQSAFDAFKGEIEKLGALAGKSAVTENDLDSNLASKINAAASGNHTHSNKGELDKITTGDVAKWNGKADKTEATESAAGLMPAADKMRLNSLRGVRYGATPPADMQDGEMFVQVVS